MIILQVFKYLENADTPKISFKEFNESPEDKYPDITFCFKGDPNLKNMYKEPWLRKNWAITSQKYHSMISGHSNAWKESLIASNISKIDFQRATQGGTLKRAYFFSDYQMTFLNGTSRNNPFLLQMSYQIPGEICFTRQFQRLSKIKNEPFLLSYERVHINSKDVAMSLYVHYPGQIMRTVFGRDRKFKSDFIISKEDMENDTTSKIFEINLSHMSVVKGRPDGNKPCNPKAYMDDNNFWLNIYRRLDCLPPYWRDTVANKTERFLHGWQLGAYKIKKLEDCRTESQFKKVHELTRSDDHKAHMEVKNDIVSSFLPPCNEMAISVSVKEKENKQKETKKNPNFEEFFIMKFIYKMQKYQEVKNEKEFSFEMLWSSIGGFVGMFIGYSMLQFLDKGLEWIMTCNDSKKSDEEEFIPLSEKIKKELWIRKQMKYLGESSCSSRFSVATSPRPSSIPNQ